MHHIFIDTNTFLDFYRDSKLDFDKEKLDLILQTFREKSDVYKVYITDYLKDEVFRNREKVLKIQYDELKGKLTLNNNLPTVARNLDTYQQFYDDLKALAKSYQKLNQEFLEKSEKCLFDADDFLNQFFAIYPIHEVTSEDKLAARDRYDFGYPPGKQNSYGDALNWLHLLSKVPNNQNIYLVSRDNDFANPLNKKNINPYLEKEWRDLKNGEIIFLDSIFSLIHELDNVDKDIEKTYINEQLQKLINSTSFSETHIQISKLKDSVCNFTQEQIIQFITGFYKNHQIKWISSDPDIKEFLTLIQKNSHYSKELRESIKNELNSENDIEFSD